MIISGFNLKDFFSNQNCTVDKELAQLETLRLSESGPDKA